MMMMMTLQTDPLPGGGGQSRIGSDRWTHPPLFLLTWKRWGKIFHFLSRKRRRRKRSKKLLRRFPPYTTNEEEKKFTTLLRPNLWILIGVRGGEGEGEGIASRI